MKQELRRVAKERADAIAGSREQLLSAADGDPDQALSLALALLEVWKGRAREARGLPAFPKPAEPDWPRGK